MLINEVAKHTGLSQDTLRYYEKEGLITPHRGVNRYRQYDNDVLLRINIIQRTRNAGFSLNEVRELVNLLFSNNQPKSKKIIGTLLSKRAEIDQKINELKTVRDAVEYKILSHDH